MFRGNVFHPVVDWVGLDLENLEPCETLYYVGHVERVPTGFQTRGE